MTFTDTADEGAAASAGTEYWNDGAWHYVSSSNIDAFMYEKETQSLHIQFHGGRRYRYFNIPPSMAEGLASASSPGGWFHANLKGAPFEKE